MEKTMTIDTDQDPSKRIRIFNPETDKRLQQIEAATELAKSLKEIAPLVTDFISLVNTAITLRFEEEKRQVIDIDKRHRREILGNLLDRQLERLSRAQEKLIDQIGKFNEEDKNRFIELLIKSMDDTTNITYRMIDEL